MVMLRALVLVVFGTGSAGADPAAKPGADGKVRIPLGPSRTVEVQPWQPQARVTTKTPGINGVAAAGIVIQTDPGGDARRWPYGMWIPTPDIGDKNVLELGTNELPGEIDSTALSARFSRGLDQGVGAFLQLLLPPPKLVR